MDKVNSLSENASVVETFAERLRILFESETAVEREKGNRLSQAKTAEAIGILRSAFSKYLNADVEIGVNNLVKIAKYYNVSTDFLLGLTDASPSDITDREICEKTGLTQSSLENLIRLTDKNTPDIRYDECQKPDDLHIFPPKPAAEGDSPTGDIHYTVAASPRSTMINDLLSSDGFTSWIDSLRDNLADLIPGILNARFHEIHHYAGWEMDWRKDSKDEKAARMTIYDASNDLLKELIEAYLQRHRAEIDEAEMEYRKRVEDYEFENISGQF